MSNEKMELMIKYLLILFGIVTPIVLIIVIKNVKQKKKIKARFLESIPINPVMNENLVYYLETGMVYKDFYDYIYVNSWCEDLNWSMQQFINVLKKELINNLKIARYNKYYQTSKGIIREIYVGYMQILTFDTDSINYGIGLNGRLTQYKWRIPKPSYYEVLNSNGFNLYLHRKNKDYGIEEYKIFVYILSDKKH